MNPILITVITLTAIGLLVAAILFLVAKKFKVEEDARIDDVEALLPGANCGGCGSAGCRDFATKLVSLEDLGDVQCPVGGSETMNKIAALLGKTAVAQAPKVAVVKCNGSCEVRPKTSNYEGYPSCKVKASLYSGDTGCRFGCLGCGDCTRVCKFDAIKMDPATGLPVVDESKCTGCGACSKACPKGIIEIRPKGPRGLKVVIRCSNTDKGAVARKACKAACIGCAKCQKACPHDAIVVENNLAYIDPAKCKLCTKCVDECPTGAIHKLNFPVKKAAAAPETPAQEVKPASKPAAKPAAKPVKPEPVQPADEPKPAMRSAARFKTVSKPAEAVKPAEVAKPEPLVQAVPAPEKPAPEPVKVEVKPEPVKAEPAKVEVKAEPVKVAEEPAKVKAEPAPAAAEEAPKPAPRKRAPRKTAPKAEEPAQETAAMEIEFPGEKPAEVAPKPKRTRTPKPKAPKPADDRDDVIDLDLFSGGV